MQEIVDNNQLNFRITKRGPRPYNSRPKADLSPLLDTLRGIKEPRQPDFPSQLGRPAVPEGIWGASSSNSKACS